YTPLRAASTSAPLTADAGLPPAPMTVTAENCVAPVKINNDIAHACAMDDPALMAPTPKVKPNAPTATPRVTLAMTTERVRGSRHASVPGEPRRAARRRVADSGRIE